MQIGTILSIITFGFTIFLGTWVLGINRKNKTNQRFFLLTLSIGLWVFCNILVDILHEYDLSMFFTKISTPFISLIPICFLQLVFNLNKSLKQKKIEVFARVIRFILLSLTIIFSLTFLSKFNVVDIKILPIGLEFYPGILYYVLLIDLLIGFSFALYYLSIGYSSLQPQQKEQIKILILGTTAAVVPGIITGIFFPVIGYSQTSMYTPSISIIFIISIAYAITRHQLFSIKAIAIELATFALWLVISIRVLLSSSIQEAFLELGFLATTLVFGISLIRSTRHELAQRAKIEKLSVELRDAYSVITEMKTSNDSNLTTISRVVLPHS